MGIKSIFLVFEGKLQETVGRKVRNLRQAKIVQLQNNYL